MRPSVASRIAPALACCAVLAFPASAHAYRPFDGTDAEVAEFGELEIELGSAYTFQALYYGTPPGSAGAAPVVLTVPALVVNVGIWPRFELVLETDNQLGKIAAGSASDPFAAASKAHLEISDTHLFLKSVLRKGFAQEKTGPSIALEVGPWLPNPNGEVGIGGSANLINSFEAGPMVLNVNTQVALDLVHHVELFASVILEGPRAHAVRPVTEIYAQHEFGGPTIYSGLVGAIWKARKAADLDVGVEGLSVDGVPMGRIRLGLTFRAPLWHGHAE